MDRANNYDIPPGILRKHRRKHEQGIVWNTLWTSVADTANRCYYRTVYGLTWLTDPAPDEPRHSLPPLAYRRYLSDVMRAESTIVTESVPQQRSDVGHDSVETENMFRRTGPRKISACDCLPRKGRNGWVDGSEGRC